jgi:hypothetical protein
MKMGIIGAGLVAVMALSAVTAGSAESDYVTVEEQKGFTIAGVRIANPLDSSTWWDGSTHLHLDKAPTIAINFADPDFWMSIPDVEKHSLVHKSLLNPATWAQFAKPSTYTAMMDVNVWKKWAELDTYAVLVDPQTYTYRLQPGAFMHTFDARSYAQLANPSAYGVIFDTMVETAGLTSWVDAGKSAVSSVLK